MKTIIAKMICVVLTAPLIPIMLIGSIPYALFKGDYKRACLGKLF